MKRIALQTLQGQLKKEISKEDPILPFGPLFSKVFQLRNGSYVKLYDPYFLQHIKQLSPYDIERKIIDAKPVSNVPEIIVPSHAVYNEKNGLFTFRHVRPLNSSARHDILPTMTESGEAS